jgi:hypothetical protein
VPHSHIDHGWISTVEAGTVFSNLTIQKYKPVVEDILRSVFCYSVATGRKFVWGEVYYFQRWYNSLAEDETCPSIFLQFQSDVQTPP